MTKWTTSRSTKCSSIKDSHSCSWFLSALHHHQWAPEHSPGSPLTPQTAGRRASAARPALPQPVQSWSRSRAAGQWTAAPSSSAGSCSTLSRTCLASWHRTLRTLKPIGTFSLRSWGSCDRWRGQACQCPWSCTACLESLHIGSSQLCELLSFHWVIIQEINHDSITYYFLTSKFSV